VLVACTGLLTLGLAVVLVVGAANFDVTGYGGTKELGIAIAILGSSVLLYLFRHLVQDATGLRLRERPSATGRV
jgi:hypothetical protein